MTACQWEPSAPSGLVLVGAPVTMTWSVADATGTLVTPDTIVLTATSGATVLDLTSLLEEIEVGVFGLSSWVPPAVGRWVLRLVTTGVGVGADEVTVDVVGSGLGQVTVAEVRAYLGDTSASDATLGEVLAAERQAQADRCRVDPFTAALREGLLRRCARNVAARAVPIASYTSFDGGGGTALRVPQSDPEIVRLEAPYRRRLVG